MALLDEIKGMSEYMGNSPNDGFVKVGIDPEEWARLVLLNCPNLIVLCRTLNLGEELSTLTQLALCSGALVYSKLLVDKTKIQ